MADKFFWNFSMISVTQFKSIKYYSHYLPHQLANKIDKYIILEINKEAKDGEEIDWIETW